MKNSCRVVYFKTVAKVFHFIILLFCFNCNIAIRNGKIRTQSTRACMKYKQKAAGNHGTVKSKRISFVLCPEFKNVWWELLNSSRAASGISFFRALTKGGRMQHKLEKQHCCSYYLCYQTGWRKQLKKTN